VLSMFGLEQIQLSVYDVLRSAAIGLIADAGASGGRPGPGR
jgi:hypothetical protein